MVDTEVESILREIRERVRAEQDQVRSNSQESEAYSGSAASHDQASTTPEALARLDGYLTTTGRAWDRLPPVVSNRSGALAKLELWIKRRLKVATRWYAWEQINFNAAVHHALRDTVEALSSFDQRLQQTAQRFEEVQAELQVQLKVQRDHLKSQMALIESQHAITELQRAQIETQRADSESQARIAEAKYVELKARLTELAQELGNRDERLLEEQRVCLKQLSLEISEASTLFDRARRQVEKRLTDLEDRKLT